MHPVIFALWIFCRNYGHYHHQIVRSFSISGMEGSQKLILNINSHNCFIFMIATKLINVRLKPFFMHDYINLPITIFDVNWWLNADFS